MELLLKYFKAFAYLLIFLIAFCILFLPISTYTLFTLLIAQIAIFAYEVQSKGKLSKEFVESWKKIKSIYS